MVSSRLKLAHGLATTKFIPYFKKKKFIPTCSTCRLETRGRPLAATNLTLVLGRNNKRKNIRKTCPPERRLFS
ncbi:hypothetical protein GQ55_9G382200 [Panicum hallii var. hallii]|uniref:Uncharacterized protein n=1 Tax=Panicum hallii var. hallii TaxID=1504633 RepID=A0A2T7C9A0_9POAL|nr:hypothetical protein GQ55_9G382200 [Panicum hallii var. hallii]PUZ39921.1 hypothetical protein GQ55_9G382200 [Panicum hallii var. hallii]